MSLKPNDTKSFQQYITNIIQGSLSYGDGKYVTNRSVITSILIVIFIIGLSLLYSTPTPTKNRRLTSAIFLGIGGTLLLGFVSMASIAYRPKTMNKIQWIINLFVLLMFAYFYAVYCLFPLIIYVDQNYDIYNIHNDDYDVYQDSTQEHKYTKVTNIINIITNILIICIMIYILYLLLWRQNTALLTRQLLPIAVVFGVAVGKSVKEIINQIN